MRFLVIHHHLLHSVTSIPPAWNDSGVSPETSENPLAGIWDFTKTVPQFAPDAYLLSRTDEQISSKYSMIVSAAFPTRNDPPPTEGIESVYHKLVDVLNFEFEFNEFVISDNFLNQIKNEISTNRTNLSKIY